MGVNLAEKILTDYLNGEMTENDIELLQLESRFSSHSAIQERWSPGESDSLNDGGDLRGALL